MKRSDLSEVISEAKEIVDRALPLESSVVKDQLIVMIVAQLMQERMPPPPFPRGALSLLGLSNEGMIAAQLTKLAMEKDKEWVWKTYCYFGEKLVEVMTRLTDKVPGLVDERNE